jgi:hypothetical protein
VAARSKPAGTAEPLTAAHVTRESWHAEPLLKGGEMVLVISGDIDGASSVNKTNDDDIHVTGKIDGSSNAVLVSNHGSIVIDGKVDGSSSASLTAAKDISIGVVGGDGDKKIDGSSHVTARAGGQIFLGNKIDGSSIVDFQACGGISIGDKIDGGSKVRLSVLSGTINVHDKIDNGSTEVQFFPAGSLKVGGGIQGGANVHVLDWAGPAHQCTSNYTVVLMLWGPPQLPKQTKWPSTLTGKGLSNALTTIAGTTYFDSLAQYNVGKVTIKAGDPPQLTNPLPKGDEKFTTRFSLTEVGDVITKNFSSGIPSPDSFSNTIPVYIVITPRGGLATDAPNSLGEHGTSTWGPSKIHFIFAYVGAQSDLNDTLSVATHEIVEAIGRNGSAQIEICDGCQNKYGGGVNAGIGSFTVASYLDAQNNKCVAPPNFSKDA